MLQNGSVFSEVCTYLLVSVELIVIMKYDEVLLLVVLFVVFNFHASFN